MEPHPVERWWASGLREAYPVVAGILVAGFAVALAVAFTVTLGGLAALLAMTVYIGAAGVWLWMRDARSATPPR